MQSTSSSRQFVHGAPCSVTLQRTFRARQHWQAFDARLLTGLGGAAPSKPAVEAFLFWTGDADCIWGDMEPSSSELAMLKCQRGTIVDYCWKVKRFTTPITPVVKEHMEGHTKLLKLITTREAGESEI
jgi:hypothetical protein